jgi:hypothetical protein
VFHGFGVGLRVAEGLVLRYTSMLGGALSRAVRGGCIARVVIVSWRVRILGGYGGCIPSIPVVFEDLDLLFSPFDSVVLKKINEIDALREKNLRCRGDIFAQAKKIRRSTK